MASHFIYPGYERPMEPGEWGSSEKIKERVALVARVLAKGGIIPWVFGNCSARIPGGSKVYMMSHAHWAGKILQELTADDIHMVDTNGNPLDCDFIDLNEEILLHIEVYKARPDVGGFIFGHPKMSCAFAEAGRDTLTLWGEKVPIIEGAEIMEQRSIAERGRKVAEKMSKANALVWNYGAIVLGKSIEEACVNAFALEWEAERQLFLTILGVKSPKPVSFMPPVEDQAAFRSKLGFQWFEAMDPFVNKVDGRLFWHSGL